MSLQLRVVPQDAVPDGVHQVRLAESDAAVDEERVVRPRRRLRHRARGGVGELVRRPDDERVERVARVQPDARRRVRRRRAVARRNPVRGRRLTSPGAGGLRLAFLRFPRFIRRNNGRRFGRCRYRPRRRRLGHELDLHHRPVKLRQRLVDEAGVVFREPVAENRVRDPHPDQIACLAQERARLEPGVEAVAVDLRLNSGEDAVPDVVAVHLRPSCAALS